MLDAYKIILILKTKSFFLSSAIRYLDVYIKKPDLEALGYLENSLANK